MRTLTITRHKSFVGCLAKDQVYIEDPQTPELTIDGFPCRKLGEVKNGKQATFQIDEAHRRIYVIQDKLSKDYCNAVVTVPEGQEDVALSGKHHFVLGSNPFRFDGVELTEEQQQKQKKNGNKGMMIFIAALIVGILVGSVVGNLLVGGGDVGPVEADPKTFSKGDFSITLTEAFTETEQEGFFVGYEARDAVVLVIREEIPQEMDTTLEEYAQAVLEASGRAGLKANQREDYLWFEYTYDTGEQELYYLAVCCCSGNTGWVINFATPVESSREYKEGFLTWADSVILEDTI